mmetsp:Transcript_8532/g.10952  ORF Transcript_8532/g.10952 Transcript_8532/m.10952 type:complete len:158 (+) Transcript_8532:42-515(+)
MVGIANSIVFSLVISANLFLITVVLANNDSNGDAMIIDEDTLLDVFASSTKDFLTRQVIPLTDADCDWSWKYARCQPRCLCEFRFKLGDYHMGRSCRRKEYATEDTICPDDEDGLNPYGQFFVNNAKRLMENVQVKGADACRQKRKGVFTKIFCRDE